MSRWPAHPRALSPVQRQGLLCRLRPGRTFYDHRSSCRIGADGLLLAGANATAKAVEDSELPEVVCACQQVVISSMLAATPRPSNELETRPPPSSCAPFTATVPGISGCTGMRPNACLPQRTAERSSYKARSTCQNFDFRLPRLVKRRAVLHLCRLGHRRLVFASWCSASSAVHTQGIRDKDWRRVFQGQNRAKAAAKMLHCSCAA